ncbi:Oidioi.mRNA.OKI2018_I69.chr2.g7190.t1.cds [Oikopleura dioica]|uniref:Oidioi.mRNA.OKI2018_I69.chr2.g7190.t1.cds n=1 Tax=Oikopleura dioica TaxID=34765 RepID=A0ABN7T7Q1_OIKDI|nr:Oidioi.mRNA.OKI2018_I69.chr2.g7190.t1.cds [Oikopleura dioica]
MLEYIDGKCGDFVIFEVGGFIGVDSNVLKKVMNMGCKVSWVSTPEKREISSYGGEMRTTKLRRIVEATGGKSFQFGVHGTQAGSKQQRRMIPNFSFVTPILGNVIKGEDHVKLLDFIDFDPERDGSRQTLRFIAEKKDIIQIQMRLISDIEDEVLLEDYCLKYLSVNVTDDEFLKLHSDPEFLIYTYKPKERKDFNSYDSEINFDVCFYKIEGFMGPNFQVQIAVYALHDESVSLLKPKARVLYHVEENKAPIFAAKPESFPEAVPISFIITSLNNPNYRTCDTMNNLATYQDLFLDDWYTGLTTGLSCSTFDSEGYCTGYFMVEIYFNRGINTFDCRIFLNESPYQPFMKVDIGMLVRTEGDCYGGGKLLNANKEELCFQKAENFISETESCVLPTIHEAHLFTSEAKLLEHNFVEDYKNISTLKRTIELQKRGYNVEYMIR